MSDAILDALQDMADAFPRDGITANTFRVYLRRLERYPEPAVLAAIEQAIDTCRFWPAIGELTDIIAQHANNADDLAETAWIEVQREARRVGYRPMRLYRNGEFVDPPQPVFSSERIREAVESLGWKHICLDDSDDTRRDFIFTYRNLRKRDTNKIQRGDFALRQNGSALDIGDATALGNGGAA